LRHTVPRMAAKASAKMAAPGTKTTGGSKATIRTTMSNVFGRGKRGTKRSGRR